MILSQPTRPAWEWGGESWSFCCVFCTIADYGTITTHWASLRVRGVSLDHFVVSSAQYRTMLLSQPTRPAWEWGGESWSFYCVFCTITDYDTITTHWAGQRMRGLRFDHFVVSPAHWRTMILNVWTTTTLVRPKNEKVSLILYCVACTMTDNDNVWTATTHWSGLRGRGES